MEAPWVSKTSIYTQYKPHGVTLESECHTRANSATVTLPELNHPEVLTDPKRWTCKFSDCNYRTNRRSNLKMHSVKHEANVEERKPYPCTFENCGYRASRKQVLDLHLSARHTPGRQRNIPCPMCPSKFYTVATLKDHIKRHVKEQLFTCSRCEFRSHDHTSLIQHVKSVHEKLVASRCCLFPGCKFSTAHRGTLNRHRRTHHNNPFVRRPFPCSFPACAYRAATADDLKKHNFYRHNLDRTRDFECALCHGSFYTSPTLTRHIRSVHVKEIFLNCPKLPSKRPKVVDDDCKKNSCEVMCGHKPNGTSQICNFETKEGTSLRIHWASQRIPAIVVLNRIHVKTV